MVQNPAIFDIRSPDVGKDINVVSPRSNKLKHRGTHFLLHNIKIENDPDIFPNLRNLIYLAEIPISHIAVVINE